MNEITSPSGAALPRVQDLLAVELQAYERELARLLAEGAHGRWVLIHGQLGDDLLQLRDRRLGERLQLSAGGVGPTPAAVFFPGIDGNVEDHVAAGRQVEQEAHAVLGEGPGNAVQQSDAHDTPRWVKVRWCLTDARGARRHADPLFTSRSHAIQISDRLFL
jgi:hypothetical protein